MNEILSLQNVYKWVDLGDNRVEILKGLSMTVQKGEFIAIMGASGSGKSTLLNLIGLLDVPSAGSLKIVGKEASNLTEDELAQLRSHSIGFIFQSFNLLPYLSAKQNVALPMGYTHRTDIHERSHRLLTQMHLAHREEAYPTTLSGGEKQRVAIARSLANEPPLLLADEPTGALDSKTGVEIMKLMNELNHAGATILMVTHDENVAKHAQRIMRMRDGRFE
jgi:putative ABC transport system ATP-binding protein